MRNFINVTKALADENRVRSLLALKGRELCLCQINELLGLAPSTVSKHMSILRQAGLVEGRKEGRWQYFRLAGDDAPVEVREAISWVVNALSKNSRIKEDVKRLKQILKLGPEELCKRQSKS